MRLFDEEVHVTLTNSNCNYITVESYEEIFFDVFEIEFGGKKYITEKVGTHNGYPVVSIPVSENNRTVEVEFVLKEGHTSEVLFNKSLAVVQKESLANYDIDDSIIIESVEESSVDEIETVLLEHEQSDKIREGILRAKESGAKFVATAYADRIIKEKMNSLESSIDLKYANLQEYVDNAKAVLFEDFVKLVNVAKESITSSNQRDKEGIESSVRTQLSECILALESSLSDKQEEAVAKFDEKLTGIANEVLTTVLLPEVSERETKIKKSLSVDVDQRLKNLHESFNAELVSAKSSITTLEKINVEITDSLKKSSSKIDLVEKSLHTKLKEASKKIQLLVESETVKVTEYYNHKIELIEKDISNKLTSTDKEEIIALVESSKQSIISELASTQRDIPNIIIEKANGSKELNVDKLKSEVEKSISTSVTNKFSTEIQALKRLVEMSSGGGSVAKQFANGGTMNGNLTVTGSISASNYLGLVIPNPDLTEYLPISGGTITGDLTVKNTLSAYSLSADRIFVSQLDALSANITVIDIKQYELSGFNVTGDCTIQGSVSSNNAVYGNNLVYLNGNTAGSNLIIGTNDSYNLALETNGVNRMTILSSGNIGIGTPTPNEKLTVVGNISASGTIIASNYNPGANVATFLQTPTSSNLRAALSDETGTGANVFADNATISSPTINTALTLNATTYTYGVSAKESLRLSQGVANSWVNKDGLIPLVQLFEDFPQGVNAGSQTIGTHGWQASRITGGSNSSYTAVAGSTQLAWGMQSLTTAATVSADSSLQLGSYNGQCGNPIGSSMQICFAVPAASISQSYVTMGYIGGGGKFVTYLDFAASKFYFSYINSSSVYINTDLATGLTLSAGDFVSGKRYRMYMRLITSTTSEFYLASADWNSSTWTTIYDNIVTHAAPNHRDTQTTPIFGITTNNAVSKTMYVDWAALEFNRQR